MEYDVRKSRAEEIEGIRVADTNPERFIVEIIKKASVGVTLEDSNSVARTVIVTSIEHWENIKLGVEKAIQLGWLKND